MDIDWISSIFFPRQSYNHKALIISILHLSQLGLVVAQLAPLPNQRMIFNPSQIAEKEEKAETPNYSQDLAWFNHHFQLVKSSF